MAGFRAVALALAAASAVVLPAKAQEGVLHAPEAIRACLCRDQSVAALARAVGQDRRAYDAARQRYDSLSKEAEAARQKLNPNDAAARDAVGRLLGQRDAAQHELASATAPLNAVVARYNAAVQSFNSDCAGKAYDAAVLPQIRSNLTCPPEALPPPT
ncbi:MAG: hypothetical protein ACREFQ_03865 [Stellaceae bacterium]